MPGKVIAIANQKGGVGKTTTTISLAAALARNRHRVLCLDLDPQAALTASTIGDLQGINPNVYTALDDPSKLTEAVHSTREGFDVAVGSAHLAGAEIELAGVSKRHSRVAEMLREADYDFILIDCPPSLGLLTVNALAAARWVLIPVAAEYLALRGLAMLMDAIERVRSAFNPDLDILGILPTLYESRTLHAREVVAALKERFEELVFPVVVRRTVRFRETPIAQQSILSYAPKSEGAKMYRKLGKEVIRRAKTSSTKR